MSKQSHNFDMVLIRKRNWIRSALWIRQHGIALYNLMGNHENYSNYTNEINDIINLLHHIRVFWLGCICSFVHVIWSFIFKGDIKEQKIKDGKKRSVTNKVDEIAKKNVGALLFEQLVFTYVWFWLTIYYNTI